MQTIVTLEVECGKGTYIRSLGRDLAESLGTAAVLSALVRTSIGSFRIDEAVDPFQVTRANWTDHLQPALRAVEAMPRVELSREEITQIGHGHEISKQSVSNDASQFAAVNAAGQLVAILTRRAPGLLGPLRNLPPE